MKPPYPPVLVRWIDSTYDKGSTPTCEAEAFQPYRTETLGFLLTNDADRVVVASEAQQDGKWRDITTIPGACVLSITRLKRAGKQKRGKK